MERVIAMSRRRRFTTRTRSYPASRFESEIARVLREVDFIENEALMQLRALPRRR